MGFQSQNPIRRQSMLQFLDNERDLPNLSLHQTVGKTAERW